MADVAFLLHWPPATMDAMSLAELMQWRQLAVERHKALHPPER
ncbi:GpE family phage tail protein [Acidovorax sp. GBBC 3332]|nr:MULTISPECIES: GpE family phage tail protein [unclassified Acidovorax]MDA8448481.1 GpE family phage tail protein [Acidovorax sp. GBBC 3297]MDA8457552.1 GpE family phage tail protein [Acidovorax sp. GBBC 3333]MDA8462924.1 GpE family phage tail protein [Acidovorax sp. GBBC 3332]MDA8467622.1 GpE family phage tail protein [Acidovorax sp. GBBC 3299]